MRRAFLVGVLLVLCNCHHRRAWTVAVPWQPQTVPLDAYFAFVPLMHAGGVEPGPVAAEDLAARCADATICSVKVVPVTAKPGFVEVRVYPARVGATQIVIDANNHIYNDREHHVFDVRVVEPAPTAPIAIGAAAPRGGQIIDRGDDGADRGHCASDETARSSIYGDGVLLYRCSEIEAGRYRLGGTYTLCAQEHDGAVAGVTRLAPGTNGELTITSTTGTFTDRACEPRR